MKLAKNHMKSSLAAALFALTFAVANALVPVQAESPYPERAMSWIVPLAAGGPTDALTRNIASRMSQKLGVPIVIENVTGAGGTIGAARAATSPGDGYHFLVGHMGFMAAAPSLYKTLRYDPVSDFQAVFRFPDMPVVLLVSANSPFRTMEELIAYAKEHPGRLNFGTSGVGSMSHLAAELFASELQLEIATVPYRGNAPAVADLAAGRVDAVFDLSNTALTHVRNGLVKALAVASRSPMEQFVGVPTVAQTIPDFEAVAWFGVFAPKDTPQAYLEILEDAYLEVMQDAEFSAMLFDTGLQLLAQEDYKGSRLQQLTIDDAKRWATVIARANLEPR